MARASVWSVRLSLTLGATAAAVMIRRQVVDFCFCEVSALVIRNDDVVH